MIRLAKQTDLGEITSIIEATRPLLLRQGSKQWNTSDHYPNTRTFREDIENKILYVIEKKDYINAVFAITITPEDNYTKVYKGSWINKTSNYIAIHRLAVNPVLYNTGLASEVIEFAKDFCLKEGYKSIKVDTHPKNSPMNKLLIKQNFKRCGEIRLKRTSEDNIRIAYELLIK